MFFSHYLLFVINLKRSSTILSTVQQSDFGTGIQRSRRGIINGTKNRPDYYIGAFLDRTDLPTTLNLGDGSTYKGYVNYKLISGNYYVTFLRAFVRKVIFWTNFWALVLFELSGLKYVEVKTVLY